MWWICSIIEYPTSKWSVHVFFKNIVFPNLFTTRRREITRNYLILIKLTLKWFWKIDKNRVFHNFWLFRKRCFNRVCSDLWNKNLMQYRTVIGDIHSIFILRKLLMYLEKNWKVSTYKSVTFSENLVVFWLIFLEKEEFTLKITMLCKVWDVSRLYSWVRGFRWITQSNFLDKFKIAQRISGYNPIKEIVHIIAINACI